MSNDTNPNKPSAREWWLVKRNGQWRLCGKHNAGCYKTDGYEVAHAIEIETAAVERLREELAEMTERHNIISDTCKLRQGTIQLLQEQRDKLREENERLFAAVNRINNKAAEQLDVVYEKEVDLILERDQLRSDLAAAYAALERIGAKNYQNLRGWMPEKIVDEIRYLNNIARKALEQKRGERG